MNCPGYKLYLSIIYALAKIYELMFTSAVAKETMMNRTRRLMRVTAANTPGVKAGHGFDDL